MSRLQKVVRGIKIYYKYQPLILTKTFISPLFFHLNVGNEISHVPLSKWIEEQDSLRIIFTFLVTVMVVISDSDSVNL